MQPLVVDLTKGKEGPWVVRFESDHDKGSPRYFSAAKLRQLQKRCSFYDQKGYAYSLVWRTDPDRLVANRKASKEVVRNLIQGASSGGNTHEVLSEAQAEADALKEAADAADQKGHTKQAQTLREKAKEIDADAGAAKDALEQEAKERKLDAGKDRYWTQAEDIEAERKKRLEARPTGKKQAVNKPTDKPLTEGIHSIPEAKLEARRKLAEEFDKLGTPKELTLAQAVALWVNIGGIAFKNRNIRIIGADSAAPKRPVTYLLNQGMLNLVGIEKPTDPEWRPPWRTSSYALPFTAATMWWPNQRAQATLMQEYGPWMRRTIGALAGKFGFKRSDPGTQAILDELNSDAYEWLIAAAAFYDAGRQARPDKYAAEFEPWFKSMFFKNMRKLVYQRKYEARYGSSPTEDQVDAAVHKIDEGDLEEPQGDQLPQSRFYNPEQAIVLADAAQEAEKVLLPAEHTQNIVDEQLEQGRIRGAFEAAFSALPQEVAEDFKRAKSALERASDAHEEAALDAKKWVGKPNSSEAKIAKENVEEAKQDLQDAQADFDNEAARFGAAIKVAALAKQRPANIDAIRTVLHAEVTRTKLSKKEAFALTAFLNLLNPVSNEDMVTRERARTEARDPNALLLPKRKGEKNEYVLLGARSYKEVARMASVAAKKDPDLKDDWEKNWRTHWMGAKRKLEQLPRSLREAVATTLGALAVTAHGQKVIFLPEEHGPETVPVKVVPNQAKAQKHIVKLTDNVKRLRARQAKLGIIALTAKRKLDSMVTKQAEEELKRRRLPPMEEWTEEQVKKYAAKVLSQAREKVYQTDEAKRFSDSAKRAKRVIDKLGGQISKMQATIGTLSAAPAVMEAKLSRVDPSQMAAQVLASPLTREAEDIRRRTAVYIEGSKRKPSFRRAKHGTSETEPKELSDAEYQKLVEEYHSIPILERHKRGLLPPTKYKPSKASEGHTEARMLTAPEIARLRQLERTVTKLREHVRKPRPRKLDVLSTYERFLRDAYGATTPAELDAARAKHAESLRNLGPVTPQMMQEIAAQTAAKEVETQPVAPQTPQPPEPPPPPEALPIAAPKAAQPLQTPPPQTTSVAAKVLIRQMHKLTGQAAIKRIGKQAAKTRKAFSELFDETFLAMIDLRKAVEAHP